MAELNSDALVEEAHKTTGVDAFDCDSYRDRYDYPYGNTDSYLYANAHTASISHANVDANADSSCWSNSRLQF